jgi:hypothetical protein
MSHALLARVLVVVSLAIATHAAATTLSVTFQGSAVEVTGATPHGKVVLSGVASEPRGYYSRLHVFNEVLEDTDGDGVIHKEYTGITIWKSVWSVVDLGSHTWVGALPERSPGRLPEHTPAGAVEQSIDPLAYVIQPGELVELVYVRPTGDVFQAQVIDGGSDDGDGEANEQVKVSIDTFVQVAGTGQKPATFQPGDLIFVVDPDDLSLTAVKVH